jgi:L-lactate dehydrogenase complex protein LldG
MSAATREQVQRAIRQALEACPETLLPAPPAVPAAVSADELVARFVREAERAGAEVVSVSSRDAAHEQIRHWLEACGARHIVCASTPGVVDLALRELPLPGIRMEFPGELTDAEGKRTGALAADVGISDADYGLADTGTLVVRATPAQGRLVSLLPPVHIAVLSRQRIVPDLAACFRALNMHEEARRTSLLTLITGPSRTADIEQTLTIGVHGPGALHILLVD